jgi:hypothetical protein
MKKGLILLFAVALACSFAAAQVPTGRFIGKVADEQGSPLPGVAVEATSPRLVGTAATVTDATGTYRLFSLPSGEYTLTFALQGFKTYKREAVVLQLEQTITLNVTLEVSTLEEEVTVIGQSPLIDVKSTTKSSVMTKEVFMKLPRNRDFNGLLSTVPGVQYESNQGGLSVDGASGGENMFYIDGTNINNIHRGYQAQSMVMEQVEEVKVTASGYNAEFGGSMGGVVNVISRSGGNEFHGDLFAYYNNNETWMQGRGRDYLRTNPYQAFPYELSDYEYVNSEDLLNTLIHMKRDPYARYEAVLNLSGYILKDKLWFFASFNPTYTRTDYTRWFGSDPVNLEEADVPGDTQADPRQGRTLYPDFWTNNYYAYGSAKLTAQPLKKMRMSLSYVNNYSWYNGGNIPSSQGTSSKNQAYNADWENTTALNGTTPGYAYPNWSANITADYTASNNFLISLRGGYMHQNTNKQQQIMPGTRYIFNNSNVGLLDVPADLQHYGGWTNWAISGYEYKKWIQDRTSVNLDFTYYVNLAGEHAWKGGVQWIRNYEDVDRTFTAPYVYLNWGTSSYYVMPGSGDVVQGAYGWYSLIHNFVSPYGNFWEIHSDAWALYIQDSWTIGDRLTLNLGLRTESEYIPAMTTDETIPGYTPKPIEFGFSEKLAPRLGAIYDVFGDSSLKIFASYGVYYDVMKLYMAEGAYGGFKWQSTYYDLDNYNWPAIAASGDRENEAEQALGGDYAGAIDWRHRSFGEETDPNMLPISQSEFSFGLETRISEELSFSARGVYKHLITTIEDIGYLLDGSEAYVIGNPGLGAAKWTTEGGLFDPNYWACPEAKREYYGVNLALEKRFSHNWQGGINYTWSQTKGNYGGLYSSDENGRQGPNVDRYFDLWFERYDLYGNPLDGILPSDRTHYFKVFGSYSFPFGLTAGIVAYGRSGLPVSTMFGFNSVTAVANGYGDLGRTPFLFTTDIYVEYNIKLGSRYNLNLNATVYNATNTSTITSYVNNPHQNSWYLDYDVLVQQGTPTGVDDWTILRDASPTTIYLNPTFGQWNGRNGTWSMRFGLRFGF